MAVKSFITLAPGGNMGPQYACNVYLLKNHKIANNSTTNEAWEKNKHRFGILGILQNFKCRFH